jgi:hypothetical protein
MRRIAFAFICGLGLGAFAMAQGKIETKWNCAKPDANPMFEVGDEAGHQYALAQGTCAATSSASGEKSGKYTEFDDIWKTMHTGHGRFNVTMDNGDMVYYTYETSGSSDMKKPLSNKWKIVNGTGTHKGTKGSGSCTGHQHEDGGTDWVCTGTTAAAGKM